MKKILALALALVLVLSIASMASAETVLQFWHTGNAGGKLDAVKYAVDTFNETIGKEKGIRVEETFIGNYDELTAKVQLSVQAGEQPNIIIAANTMVGWLVEDELLADLMPYAEKDGFDASNILDCFMLTMGNRDGQLMSVPFFRSTPMLYYNKTMADAAGLTPPRTIEELEAFAKALYKVADNGDVEVWGFECYKDFGYYNCANLWQLGSSMFNEDGTASPCLEDGTMLKVLSDWRRWVDEGWCRPFDSTDPGPKLKELFYQGKLACFWDSCGALTGIIDGCAGAGIELGAVPFTTYDIEKPVCEIGGGNVSVIAKGNTEEEIAASWEFIKHILSDDVVCNTSIATGYVPGTKSVATYDKMLAHWDKTPLAKVAYDQLGTAIPQEFPYVPFLQDYTVVCWDASSLLIQDKSLDAEGALEYIKTNTADLF